MAIPSRSRVGVPALQFFLILSSILTASAAEAKLAYVQFCTLPTLVGGSAAGTCAEVRATIHDVADNPLAGQGFMLDFSQTTFRLFEVQDPGVMVDCERRTLTAYTNLWGEVAFRARFAGMDPGSHIEMYSDGVPLGWVVGCSPDLDGQGGGTGLTDFATFAEGFASGVPQAALNFDGSTSDVPDLVDFAVLSEELAAASTAPYCP